MAMMRCFLATICLVLAVDVYARDGLSSKVEVTDETPVELYYHGGGGFGHTETTHQSVFGVLKEKLIHAVIGFGLVLLAFPVLYFNEKRQVHMEKIFNYGESIVKDGVKSAPLDPGNESCLVNVQGTTSTSEELRDPSSGITVSNCAHLRSSASMYQWVENQQTEERDTNTGGKETITTYSYSMDWRDSPQDSGSFKETGGHENPPFYVNSASQTAKEVQFGDYMLTPDLITQMRNEKPLVGEQELEMGGRQFRLEGNTYTTQAGSPQLGDMRYSLTKVECAEATVLSIQSGNSFTALKYNMIPSTGCSLFGGGPSAGDKVAALQEPLLGNSDPEIHGVCSAIGAAISMKEELNDLAEELLSASAMFARAKAAQDCIRKVLKLVGFLMFYVGFYMQFSFFPALFRFIPFVGTWIESFGNFFACLGAVFMALFHYCVTVGVAWMVLRPLKGILMLLFAAAILVVPSMLAQQAQAGQ